MYILKQIVQIINVNNVSSDIFLMDDSTRKQAPDFAILRFYKKCSSEWLFT
jgi:hypothetical protein